MFWPEVLLRVGVVGMVCIVTATVVWYFQRADDYKSLLVNYKADIVRVDQSLENSSWFDGETVKVKKDGHTYTCKNVQLEDLRQLQPIVCPGATITVK